jgi:hypothetical protein
MRLGIAMALSGVAAAAFGAGPAFAGSVLDGATDAVSSG